jgi:hypothetical protein
MCRQQVRYQEHTYQEGRVGDYHPKVKVHRRQNPTLQLKTPKFDCPYVIESKSQLPQPCLVINNWHGWRCAARTYVRLAIPGFWFRVHLVQSLIVIEIKAKNCYMSFLMLEYLDKSRSLFYPASMYWGDIRTILGKINVIQCGVRGEGLGPWH